MSDRSFRSSSTWKSLERQIRKTHDTCFICGGFVNTSIPAGFPESPEIEHIIPISRGGAPLDAENLALAHKMCNQKKGGSLIQEIHKEKYDMPQNRKVIRKKRSRKWVE